MDTLLSMLIFFGAALIYLIVTLIVDGIMEVVMGYDDSMVYAWLVGMVMFSATMVVAVMGVMT